MTVRPSAQARLRREEVYRARLVIPVLAVAAFAWVAFLVFTLRAGAASWAFVVTFGVGTLSSALLARAGHVSTASVLLLVVASHPAAALISHYGVSSPAGATLLLTIVGYGLLVGRSSLVMWTAVCCVLLAFVAVTTARAAGAPVDTGAIAAWCALYVGAAGLTGLIARGFEGLIQLARGQSHSVLQLLNDADPAAGTGAVAGHSLAVVATELGARSVALWLGPSDGGTLVREHVHPARDAEPAMVAAMPAWWGRLVNEGVLDLAATEWPGTAAPPPRHGLVVRLGPAPRPSGMMVIEADARRRFDRDDRDLALALAQQTALALHLARAATRERETAVLEDRHRIAREIHDGLAQGFTGVVLQVNAAEQVLGRDVARAREHLDAARALARASLADARRSVWALRPAALGNSGLGAALDRMAREMAAPSGVEVTTEVDERAAALPADLEAELLRVGQEAITNALRHGAPRRLVVSVRRRPGAVRLAVRDDGRGLETRPEANGFGSTAMRERAARLGGRLRVTSMPGRGTEVSLLVPLPAAAEPPVG